MRDADNVNSPTLPLVRNQWAEVRVEIDFATDTQRVFYNGAFLTQESWSYSSATTVIAVTVSMPWKHRSQPTGAGQGFDVSIQGGETLLEDLDRPHVVLEHDLVGGVLPAEAPQPLVVPLRPGPALV